MELEEMKSMWDKMSADIEKQKKLTGSLIIKMTEVNYRNKINKILVPELIGAAGCLAGFVYIHNNFQKLDTPYLAVCGGVAAVIALALPVLSVRSVYKMRAVNISDNNYKESLLQYSKRKIQFVFVQKLNLYLSAILMLVILPVMGKLISGKDFFKETNLWMWYAILFPFFYFAARWVFKCYIKSAKDAEDTLKELDTDV